MQKWPDWSAWPAIPTADPISSFVAYTVNLRTSRPFARFVVDHLPLNNLRRRRREHDLSRGVLVVQRGAAMIGVVHYRRRLLFCEWRLLAHWLDCEEPPRKTTVPNLQIDFSVTTDLTD